MIPLVTKTLLLNHLTQSQAGMLFLLSFTLICKTFATPARRDIMQSSQQQAFDTLPVVGYEPEHQVICWTRTKIAKVTQIFQGQVQKSQIGNRRREGLLCLALLVPSLVFSY